MLSHRPERLTTSPIALCLIKPLQTYALIPKLQWGRKDLTSHRFFRWDHELLKYHVWKEVPTVRTYQPKSPIWPPLRQHQQP
jgi:hypothetical protein